MNKSLVLAALAAVLFASQITTPALAQQRPAAPPAGARAALVDMSVIMKNSNRFNAAMEKLKAQYEAKAEELKKDGERGNQLTEQMRQMPQNSPERKQAEDQVLRLRADYELKGKRATEEIRDNESKIVLGLVSEVKGHLEQYGQATGTQLILRANPVPPNLTDPRVILQEIHKPIVYQANLDATPQILSTLNRGVAPPPTAAAPVRSPAPPQGIKR